MSFAEWTLKMLSRWIVDSIFIEDYIWSKTVYHSRVKRLVSSFGDECRHGRMLLPTLFSGHKQIESRVPVILEQL